MPKFTDKERSRIREQLMKEGLTQFSKNGCLKVTISDLTEAVGIAKGSFYAFFESKEHLFMAINYQQQKAMYDDMASLLPTLKEKAAEKIAVYTFRTVIDTFIHNPFLSKINSETLFHLKRKLGEDLFRDLNYDDTRMIGILNSYDVAFSQDDEIMVKSVQALLAAALVLKEDSGYEDIMTLLIEGFVAQTIL